MIKYPYNTKTITLPGNCEISYIDEGTGARTLVFIHGLANYALVWKKNIDYLKQYYRCIAIDLPGNGLSDRNEHEFTMDFFAESVYNLIVALGLLNVCIVGHSMGGQVAITTVIKYPECANALVLCAPAGFEEFTDMEKTLYHSTLQMIDFISSDEHSLRSTINHSFYRKQPHVEHMIKELVEIMKTYKPQNYKKMLDGCIKSMLAHQVHDKLQLIKQKTLVIFGKEDALIPNRLIHHISTEQLAIDAVKQIPVARLKMIPDCGHFVHWEKADEVNSFISGFLG